MIRLDDDYLAERIPLVRWFLNKVEPTPLWRDDDPIEVKIAKYAAYRDTRLPSVPPMPVIVVAAVWLAVWLL